MVVKNKAAVIVLVGIMVVIMCFSGCKKSDIVLDLSFYIEEAQSTECADILNQIFQINDELVLTYKRGNCPDGSFMIKLYMGDSRDLLCRYMDTIGGPALTIYNLSYQEMFQVIIENLDLADFGLGSDYEVIEASF